MTTKERVVLVSAHFLCTNCNQEALLLQTDCTTRYINQNVVNCCTIVVVIVFFDNVGVRSHIVE